MRVSNNFFSECTLFFCFTASCLIIESGNCTAQCIGAGPNSGGTFSTDNSIGTIPVSNPQRVIASDDSHAKASATLVLLSGSTNYIVVKDFGFLIPSPATICGIEALVEKSATSINILAYVADNSIRLIKGGAIIGNNNASATHWTSTDAVTTYGSNSDLWGTTWTPEEITDANFGIAFSAGINGIVSLLPTARIDHITITVYYNDPLPVKWLYFKGEAGEKNTCLKWGTASESNVSHFSVERSHNGQNWTGMNNIIAAGNSTGIHEYSSTFLNDPAVGYYFYRVKETNNNGVSDYSAIIKIDNHYFSPSFECRKSGADFFIYFYSETNKKCKIILTNSKGSINYTSTINAISGYNQVKLEFKPPFAGLYIISLIDGEQRLNKNFIFD